MSWYWIGLPWLCVRSPLSSCIWHNTLWPLVWKPIPKILLGEISKETVTKNALVQMAFAKLNLHNFAKSKGVGVKWFLIPQAIFHDISLVLRYVKHKTCWISKLSAHFASLQSLAILYSTELTNQLFFELNLPHFCAYSIICPPMRHTQVKLLFYETLVHMPISGGKR